MARLNVFVHERHDGNSVDDRYLAITLTSDTGNYRSILLVSSLTPSLPGDYFGHVL